MRKTHIFFIKQHDSPARFLNLVIKLTSSTNASATDGSRCAQTRGNRIMEYKTLDNTGRLVSTLCFGNLDPLVRQSKVRYIGAPTGRLGGWLLTQPVVTSAIIGADDLNDNLAVAEPRLSAVEVKRLDGVRALPLSVRGGRFRFKIRTRSIHSGEPLQRCSSRQGQP